MPSVLINFETAIKRIEDEEEKTRARCDVIRSIKNIKGADFKISKDMRGFNQVIKTLKEKNNEVFFTRADQSESGDNRPSWVWKVRSFRRTQHIN